MVIDPSARACGAGWRRISSAEGREVVTLGSEHADAVRTAHWDRARAGACVVIGGRTAVWAPVPDLARWSCSTRATRRWRTSAHPPGTRATSPSSVPRRAGAALRVLTPAPTVDALVAVGEPVGRARPLAAGRGRRPARRGTGSRAAERGAGRRAPPHRRSRRAGSVRAQPPRAGAAARVPDVPGAGAVRACAARRSNSATTGSSARTATPRVRRCASTATAARSAPSGRGSRACATTSPHCCRAPRWRRSTPSTDAVPDVPVLVGTEAVLHRVRGAGRRPVGLVAYLELDQELLAPRARAAEQALWLLVRGARLLDDPGRLLAADPAARPRGRARGAPGRSDGRGRRRAHPSRRRSGSRPSAGWPR